MLTVPLFPLNTVVFPGAATPLHVFEDRYRTLVADLLRIPDPAERVFAILAIREGFEVGAHGSRSVHRVGTLVQLTGVEPYDDGRCDIETIARQRLWVSAWDDSGAYLRGRVELMDEDADVAAADVHEAERARQAFEDYRSELSGLRGGPVLTGELPTDPSYLSYALGATCLLTLPQRQTLLEAPDARTRLRMIRRLLREERRAMRALPSLPATEVARTGWSPN